MFFSKPMRSFSSVFYFRSLKQAIIISFNQNIDLIVVYNFTDLRVLNNNLITLNWQNILVSAQDRKNIFIPDIHYDLAVL